MTGPKPLVDLAAARLGGVVLAANDDFFAAKENLIAEADPVFEPGRYTERGKWMDGWETRRRRTPGNDWALLRLGAPGAISRLIVDTTHFKGNFPESCAVFGCIAPAEERVGRLLDGSHPWHEVLPRTRLAGDRQNVFEVKSPWRYTHLRLDIFPDGGVARLRALGEVVADWRRAAGASDLAALARGGRVVDCSERFFGAPERMLLPGPAAGMFDGWETRRRRGPGHDWAVVRLAVEGEVERLEVDTSWFRGNAPGSCAVRACVSDEEVPPPGAVWQTLLPETKLESDNLHLFAGELRQVGPATHVRLDIFPDGGVARFRVVGRATARGRRTAALRWLDTLPPRVAEAALRAWGGAAAWARELAGRRPFGSWEGLVAAAGETWRALGREQWLEAFDSHPRLGERTGPAAGGGAATAVDGGRGRPPAGGGGPTPVPAAWAAQEQAAAAGADPEVLARLAEANRRYSERFGWTFVVCATGRSAEEMLEAFERRIGNDPETEMAVAAAEQKKIARIRLAKLLGVPGEGE